MATLTLKQSDEIVSYLVALLFFSGQAHDLVKFVSAFSSQKVITLYPSICLTSLILFFRV